MITNLFRKIFDTAISKFGDSYICLIGINNNCSSEQKNFLNVFRGFVLVSPASAILYVKLSNLELNRLVTLMKQKYDFYFEIIISKSDV